MFAYSVPHPKNVSHLAFSETTILLQSVVVVHIIVAFETISDLVNCVLTIEQLSNFLTVFDVVHYFSVKQRHY